VPGAESAYTDRVPRYSLTIPGTPERQGINPFTKELLTIRGKPEYVRYWEASIDGCSVEFAHGGSHVSAARWTRVFESSERAAEHVAACARARQSEGLSEDAGLKVLSQARSLGDVPAELMHDEACEPSRAVDLSVPLGGPPNSMRLRATFRHGDAGEIESVRADEELGKLGGIVSAIAEEAPSSLREVILGSEYAYAWRHKRLGNCEPLFDLGLRSIVLYGAGFNVGHVDAPHLERLAILAISPRRRSIQSILRGALPALRTLRMFLGPATNQSDELPDSEIPTIEDLKPLLDGEVLPAVRELGILNWERADSLCKVLPRSAIARRLTHLDLGGCQLLDRDLQRLVAAKTSFPLLERLDVPQCCLTEAGVSSVRAWLPNSRVDGQRRSGVAVVE
jgi:hypothetical protein